MDTPIAAVSDWLITAGSVTLALGALWQWWGKPAAAWVKARVDNAEARLVGIEDQAKEQVRLTAIANGRTRTIEALLNETAETLAAHQEKVNPLLDSIDTRMTETVAALEERRKSIDPLIAGIATRVVATDAALTAHIIEALPMIRAYNREHPEAPIPTTPVIGPPLGSPSLPATEKGAAS